MKIISFNANGIRSAAQKGFYGWFRRQRADVLCVQELKAQAEQIVGAPFATPRYVRAISAALRPGYSGVAVYSRAEPKRIVQGFGVPEFDREGRYVEMQFDNLAVVSVYLPSGSSGPERQQSKFRFLECFAEHLGKLRRRRLPYVLCGDWNIAHKPIDLKNWRSNQKKSGFLPEERAWMDWLLSEAGYVDAFRQVNQDAEQYTWWSNRGRAREKNVGWRIDYQIISPELAEHVRAASIYTGERFSDHAPLTIEYA
jgi:exodeoxyribonuclease-3